MISIQWFNRVYKARERYSTRLRYFLAKIGLMGNNNLIEELCRIFVEKGKQDPNWIINNTEGSELMMIDLQTSMNTKAM